MWDRSLSFLEDYYPEPFLMSLDENKRLLRQAAQEKRNGIVSTAPENSGDLLAAHVVQLLSSFVNMYTVSGYLPIGNEIDTLPTLMALADAGYKTCLPVVLKNEWPLDFRLWVEGSPLEDGPLKTRHPVLDATQVKPNVMLVPLLAYDDDGHRLGWGGGFYDRTLGVYQSEGCPVIAIGVCYDEQHFVNLPFGEFDIPMDWIATEKRIFKIMKDGA
jgi:5-formyltetrahydrofolate cyclo-ligase